MSVDQALVAVTGALTGQGYRVVRSFDLTEAAAAHPGCSCPHHGTELCTCRYVTLAAYPIESERGSTLVLALHSRDRTTLVSLLQGEEPDWLRALLPIAVLNQQKKRGRNDNQDV